MWSAKGWGQPAFTALFRPKINHLPQTLSKPNSANKGENRVSVSALERLSSITSISRSSIATILSQAHGPWLLHINSRERVIILEAIASIYGALDYKRKEAYILREVLGCVMDLLVCSREEVGGSKVVGAGLGIQGTNIGNHSNRGAVGMRDNESTEGNKSVIGVVKHICRLHGIDLEAVKLFATPESKISKGMHAANGQKANNGSDSEDDIILGLSSDPFGWPELQVGIIREAIAVAESLPGMHPFLPSTLLV